MDGNFIDNSGDSISNSSLNSDMYDVMNNATSDFSDSDLYDSTELKDIILSRKKARERMLNKQSKQQTATGNFKTELTSGNNTTEKNTKCNMPTFQLPNHNVKKFDFTQKNEGVSTMNACYFDESYDVMNCTKLTIRDSDLYDSTEIFEKTSGQGRRSDKVLNKKSNKHTDRNSYKTKITSTNHNTEGNVKRDLLTSEISKQQVSKLGFSRNFMVRRYEKPSISDRALPDNLNYISHLRFTNIQKESSTDKSLKDSVLASKDADKYKMKFSADNSNSKSKSCVGTKSLKKSKDRTNIYLSDIKQFYESQKFLKDSKRGFRAFQRHRHCIPIFDDIKSRDDGTKERISVFDVSFTSGWEFEDDLRFESFCEKLSIPKTPKKCSLNFKEKDESKGEDKSLKESDKEKISDKESDEENDAPTDKNHSNSSLDVNNKFSRIFGLLDFSWLSQKSKELKRKLSNSFKISKTQDVN